MKNAIRFLYCILMAVTVALFPPSAHATNYFNGLLHAPLGSAAVQADPATGSLTVSGIGSSGNDGVRIFTGNGGGATTKLGVFDPDLLPIDAFLRWAALDPTDVQLEGFTVRRTTGGGQLFAEFPGFGVPTASVALYSNDVLLAYANGIPATAPLLTFSGRSAAGGGGGLPLSINPCVLHPEDCYGVIDIDIWQPDPTGPTGPIGTIVTLPGSGPLRGTRVTIQPDPLPVVAPATIHVKEIQITGKNLRTLTLGNKYSIGLHFGADDPPPAGSALAPIDVAGAVPQAHWNNLNGPRGSASGIVADLNGAAVSTTISVEWGSPNTWSSTGRGEENNGFAPGGDRLLLTGYLDTDNGAGVATVAVFGIDPVTANTGYDVIVYILGGVSGRGGAYTIGGLTKYGTAAANPSAHSEDPGVGLADTGTYLRFTGLTGSSFTLLADANNANGPNRNLRAPINGMQIVRSSESPAEGLVYFGLEHHALGQAEYSFDAPGTFTLGNLGLSGDDGMDVTLRNANSYSADWVALNPQPLPPDRIPDLSIRAVGDWNGLPGSDIGSLRLQSAAGGTMQLIPDFSTAGATRLRVELWSNCAFVSSFTIGNGVSVLTMTDAIAGTSISAEPGDEPCGTMPLPPPVPPPWSWWVYWPINVDVSTPSGEHFQVNRARVGPDDASGTLATLSRISYQASGFSGLRFARESVERRGLNFNGNQHFPLGQARLTKTATGVLMIDNIGASGNDGVEIALGRSDYCEVASPSLPLPPPGNSCHYDFRAAVDGIRDRTAATVDVQANAAGQMVFAGDMSPLGATRYTLLVFAGDTLVNTASNQPTATYTLGGNVTAFSLSLQWKRLSYLTGNYCYIKQKIKSDGTQLPMILLGSGAAVPGDAVVILPENPTRPFGAQNRLLITAVGIHPEPKFVIREELGAFANGHTGLGNAELHANGQTLTVDHLGSSGNDGVAIDLESACNFLASFAPLDVPAVQGPYPHPWIQASALGIFGAVPDHDLGSLRLTALTPAVVQVEADFTSVGATRHTLEVWQSGALVQRFTGRTGIVARVDRLPSGIGKLGGVDPSVLPCFIAAFTGGVRVDVNSGPSLQGDELRVLTENPTAAIGDLQSLRLQAGGLGSFTIVNETLTPALAPPSISCPGDITVETCNNCEIVNYPAPAVLNGALVNCSPPSGTCVPLGTTTVACVAANGCSRSRCQFTVTVRPTPPPGIQCPTNLFVTLPCNSNCVPVSYSMPTVSNGTLVSCAPPSDTCLPEGLHTILCRATNRCSEAECVFTVRVDPAQSEPPMVRCPQDIVATTCGFGERVSYPAPVVTGADPGTYTLVCTPPSGSFFPVGSNKVACCVTDLCGRNACCEFSVIIPRGLTFDGNQHCPLGVATVTRDLAANTLALGNITDTGLDGVQIALGDADFCEVVSPPLASLGDSCRYEYRAIVGGIADRTAAILTVACNPAGEMQLTGDMSALGATRYTLLTLDGDGQVASVSNQPNATLTVAGATSVAPSLRWDIKIYKCYIRIKLPKLPGNPGPLIRLSPGQTVHGDSVIILPENPTRTLGLQNRVLLTATAIHPEPKFVFREQLGLFGIGHTGLGDATLTANGGTLTVGNLGISGNNGVAIDLESSRNFLASFVPLDVSVAQGPHPVPWIQARAYGRFGGVANHDLGSVRFTALSPTAVEVEPDFTPVGASTHTVEVWQTGQLVQRITGHAGIVGTVNGWPSGIGKLGGVDPGSVSCIWATFTGGVRVNITGGPTLEGDELRVLVENPSAAIGELQSFHLQSAGFDSFTIANEARVPGLTPRIAQISPAAGGGLQLTVPTAFGYQYTLESVNALGPQPSPWSPFQTFAGDGSVKVIPLENPGTINQFFRVGVRARDTGPLAHHLNPEEPHNIQLFLNDVKVEKQRKSEGDRPYFATIVFQTQNSTPGSTKVQLIEGEPHDWVSKEPYKTLLNGKDRMFESDNPLPIPPWMGQVEWNDVEWVTQQDLQNHSGDLRDFKIMLLGAAIISLDNRNTPPHKIRELLGQAADGLRAQLQTEVETGNLLAGLTPLDPMVLDKVQARFKQIADAAMQNVKPDPGWLFIESVGDPDYPTGVQLVVLPVMPGLPVFPKTERLTLLGADVELHTLIRSPERFDTQFQFVGSDAVYVVNARVVPDIVPTLTINDPANLVDVLAVYIRTGDDELRSSSQARGTIGFKGGRSPETFVLNEAIGMPVGLGNRTEYWMPFPPIRLSSPVQLADISSFTLSFDGKGSCFLCTGDNWNVEPSAALCGFRDGVSDRGGLDLPAG